MESTSPPSDVFVPSNRPPVRTAHLADLPAEQRVVRIVDPGFERFTPAARARLLAAVAEVLAVGMGPAVLQLDEQVVTDYLVACARPAQVPTLEAYGNATRREARRARANEARREQRRATRAANRLAGIRAPVRW